MKNKFRIAYFIVAASLVISGCKKSFNEMYNNENKPLAVPASLLFNGILNDMYEGPYTSKEKWSQYFITNYAYYGDNRYDFQSGDDYFGTLGDVIKMEDEAHSVGLPDGNVYSALAKFFKAYLFTKMSLQMGDLPMSEALKGSNNLTPVYDSQKSIFQESFSWLDSANTELSALVTTQDNNLKGDIYYNGDLSKWQKLVNTYRLRLLIELSKKTGDADLNLAGQFQTILANKSNYPVMEDMSDNLQYTFIHPTNDYPNNPGNFGFNALRDNCSGTYVGLLTSFKDPRVYVTSEPASALVTGSTGATSFSAFAGADPGEDLGTMYQKTNAGQYSLLNRWRYYETYTGEPSIQVGYPEMLFNIAEAINRGWITSGPLGTAEDYYTAGIKASMAFYGIPESGSFTAYFLASGSPGSSALYDSHSITVDFDTYYNQTPVKYAGNNANGLTQILQQKYLALYRHSGLEGYYQFRRTGVPAFTTGPGTGNSGRIPLRFKYPENEKTANAKNYQAALQSQFGGNDDINGTMWLLQ